MSSSKSDMDVGHDVWPPITIDLMLKQLQNMIPQMSDIHQIIIDFACSPMIPFACGIQYSIPEKALSHWKLHYKAPYKHKTQISDIQTKAHYLFWGAKRKGDEHFMLGAVGASNFIFSKRTEIGESDEKWKDAVPHNSAFWYLNPRMACGFSPHPKVFLYSADCAEFQGKSYSEVDAEGSQKGRLSWNLDSDESTGGFRAGTNCDLGTSNDWYKVMYVSDCI